MNSIDNPIFSRLDSLSKTELDCLANQVRTTLEKAVLAEFISGDNKLLMKFEKSLPKKMGTVVANTDDLSISDIVPIYDSEIPIGFYFDNQFDPDENFAKKFWFTVEDLLASLYKWEVPVPEGEER